MAIVTAAKEIAEIADLDCPDASRRSPMDDFGSEVVDPPRWNSWFRVSPVQFEGENHPIARGVRLCCPAARAGDPVQIIEGKRVTSARLLRVEYSILHVTTRL